MSTFEVKVRKIEIFPHDNADTLEIGKVDDYNVVVRKGMFKTGDLVAYIPVASLLPTTLVEEMGLVGKLAGSSGNRVKEIRLRKVLSQGLCLPAREGWIEGDDVAEQLGITKYVPSVPAHMAGEWQRVVIHSQDKGVSVIDFKFDIENIKKYPHIFQEGEDVTITEKVHGCVHYSTKVTMFDGSVRNIRDIVDNKIQGYVLGMNSNGELVPSKILNWFDNGSTREWFYVHTTRTKMERGNSFASVRCTGNHKFYNPTTKEYIPCSELKVGDDILLIRTNRNITYTQQQVLIGKMLGDGSYGANHVSFGHKIEHEEYVKYAIDMLGDIARSSIGDATSGFGSEMKRGSSIAHPCIAEIFDPWVTEEKKQIPYPIEIGPIALAFWYMDDGTLSVGSGHQEHTAILCTDNFNDKSLDNLIFSLEKLGINAKKRQHGLYTRIVILSECVDKFYTLIAPYIPLCMKYKLPERFRDLPTIILSKERSEYKQDTVLQKVTEIIKLGPNVSTSARKFDIETETHNFFANNMLVHNSFMCIGLMPNIAQHTDMVDGQFFVSSKGLAAKGVFLKDSEKNAGNVYIKTVKEDGFLDKMMKIALHCFVYDCLMTEVVWLVGEVFGNGVQDLRYGQEGTSFRAFGIKAGDKWLDYDVFLKVCKGVGMETVPVLYHGPFSKDVVATLTDGATVVGKGVHLREGVVVCATKSETNGGRKILKSVSEAYLFRKGDQTEYE